MITAESEVPMILTTQEEEDGNPSLEASENTPKKQTFAARVAVSLLVLSFLLLIVNSRTKWAGWTRMQLHSAIHATTGQTFGKILPSPVVSDILANSRNLIRLEKVTRKVLGSTSSVSLQNSLTEFATEAVWPVAGSIRQRFGWYYPITNGQARFYDGVEINASAGAEVVALRHGQVASFTRTSGNGWKVVLRHGGEWQSEYTGTGLGEIYVRPGQSVLTGERLIRLTQIPALEPFPVKVTLRRAGKAVDPLRVVPLE